MTDNEMVRACDKVIGGLAEQVRLEDERLDPTWEKRTTIASEVKPLINAIIDASATGLEACGAKGRLYLALNRDDLAMSLARDIVAIAALVGGMLAQAA